MDSAKAVRLPLRFVCDGRPFLETHHTTRWRMTDRIIPARDRNLPELPPPSTLRGRRGDLQRVTR